MSSELHYKCELGNGTVYVAAKTAEAAEKLINQCADDHGFSADVEAGTIFMEKIDADEFYRNVHYPSRSTVILRDLP